MIILIIDTEIEHIPCPRGADQWPEEEWNASVIDDEQEELEGA